MNFSSAFRSCEAATASLRCRHRRYSVSQRAAHRSVCSVSSNCEIRRCRTSEELRGLSHIGCRVCVRWRSTTARSACSTTAPGARSRFVPPPVHCTNRLGGALTFALVGHSAFALLPGTCSPFMRSDFRFTRRDPASTFGVTIGFALLAWYFWLPVRCRCARLWVMPIGSGRPVPSAI